LYWIEKWWEKIMIPKEKFDAHLISGGKRGPNWFKSTSPYGYNIAECISALVKEIRFGQEEDAVFWGHQVAISGHDAEKFLWEILRVHSIEECGLANPGAITTITDTMHLYFDLPERDDRRYAMLAFAVCYLSRSKKTRYSNELFTKMICQLRDGDYNKQIPDRAIDVHLKKGREMGRGHNHYLTVASVLVNEDDSFPKQVREWLVERSEKFENKS